MLHLDVESNQIPCGNDRKKSKNNSKSKNNDKITAGSLWE
jgi:hypothetical protein